MSATIRFSDSVQFTAIRGLMNFDEASDSCSRLSPPGILATFSDLTEYNFGLSTIDALQTLPNDSSYFWVGLTRDISRGSGAINFEFIDGTPNLFTVDRAFPWGPDEPNNFAVPQLCVVIIRGSSIGTDNTLEDLACDGQGITGGGALCRQLLPIITNTPTAIPTLSPITIETATPTLQPTESETTRNTTSGTSGNKSRSSSGLMEMILTGNSVFLGLGISCLTAFILVLAMLYKEKKKRKKLLNSHFFLSGELKRHGVIHRANEISVPQTLL